jgi:protein-disulfide isomerase
MGQTRRGVRPLATSETFMNTDAKRVELSVPVTERDHVRGLPDAPVVIVEYGDYECPYCGRAYWVIKELRDELGDRVGFVFRNFPVAEVHPRAEAVAEALEAAASRAGGRAELPARRPSS